VWHYLGVYPPPAAGRRLDRIDLPLFFWIFFSPALYFLRKLSTLAGWFQHVPALLRVHLKTSNIHNFWTVAPKFMKFALTRSLFQDTSLQKVSKNLKIVWDHMTQPRTGLSLVGTSGPLGVKWMTSTLNPLQVFHRWRVLSITSTLIGPKSSSKDGKFSLSKISF
jgi:hypothetical protein